MFDPRSLISIMSCSRTVRRSSIFRVRESNFEGVANKPSKCKPDDQQSVVRKDSAMLVACLHCYNNPGGVTESS